MASHCCRAHGASTCGCVAPVTVRNDRLRSASSLRLPPTSGQALCSIVYNAFVGNAKPSQDSVDFFTNLSKTVCLRDFENRNNTNIKLTVLFSDDVWLALTSVRAIQKCLEATQHHPVMFGGCLEPYGDTQR